VAGTELLGRQNYYLHEFLASESSVDMLGDVRLLKRVLMAIIRLSARDHKCLRAQLARIESNMDKIPLKNRGDQN
jgi:hypothetical protein